MMTTTTTQQQLVPVLARPSQIERAGIEAKLAREREWYGAASRLHDTSDLDEAIANGGLVEIDHGDDYRLIARFESGIEGFWRFATPKAVRMANEFMSRWRVVLREDFRVQTTEEVLALTSAVRTQQYQDRIVDAGRLASPDSTHCTGNALDFDASGYYRIDERGNVVSHTHPDRRKGQIAIAQELAKRHGGPTEPTFIDDRYDPRFTDAAILAAESMHRDEIINLVPENMGTANACLHMAVNPDY